jgi:glycosyltransferase domain-containing protein
VAGSAAARPSQGADGDWIVSDPRPLSAPPRLTIVLPLKGRHLYTLRWLWYANEARLPYRFLIADGQVNDAVARYIENSREAFRHLDIEYVRYPDDADYGRFFAKMSDAMSRVRTPYTMLADNDDFLGIDGIEQALDFMESHDDYVCACGRAAAFTVYSKLGNPDGAVYGRLNRLYIASNPVDVTAAGAAERLRQGGLYHLIYYSVYRTEALAEIWRDVVNIDFSDLMLHENFHALRTLTLGKFRANSASITYYAQVGSSLNTQPSQLWVRKLLRSRFTSDAHAMVECLSAAAAEADGVEAEPIAEDIRITIENCFSEFLSANYGWLAELKRRLVRKWPSLKSYFQARPRFFVGREKKALLAQLAACGASPQRIDRMRLELAAIETAISREAFANFAGPFLKMAHADAARNWL